MALSAASRNCGQRRSGGASSIAGRLAELHRRASSSAQVFPGPDSDMLQRSVRTKVLVHLGEG